jgi:hypothetical protein
LKAAVKQLSATASNVKDEHMAMFDRILQPGIERVMAMPHVHDK